MKSVNLTAEATSYLSLIYSSISQNNVDLCIELFKTLNEFASVSSQQQLASPVRKAKSILSVRSAGFCNSAAERGKNHSVSLEVSRVMFVCGTTDTAPNRASVETQRQTTAKTRNILVTRSSFGFVGVHRCSFGDKNH